MALLYQVDFRTQPSQLGLAAGAVTIDGEQWWLKGTLGVNFGASLENGSGLRLRVLSGTPAGLGTNGNLNEPHFFLPLSQLTGYSASQALLVRGRFTRTNISQTPVIGLADSTSDAVGLRAAQRAKDHFCGPSYTSTTTSAISVKAGTAAIASIIGRTASIANSSCVPGILNNHIVGWAIPGSQDLAVGTPTDTTSFLPGGVDTDTHFQFTTRSNPGVFFGVHSNSAHDSYLQWLRIDVLGEIDDNIPPTATAVTTVDYPVGKTDPLVIRGNDDVELRNLVVIVKFPTGDWEGAYDGAVFSSKYRQAANGSSQLVVDSTTQWTMTLRREGGWPFNPIPCVRFIDAGGSMT